MRAARTLICVISTWLVVLAPLRGEPSAEHGRQALEGRALIPATWSKQAYQDVWQEWTDQPTRKPADFASAFMERYGLFPAPYANGGYPMGLREVRSLFGAG